MKKQMNIMLKEKEQNIKRSKSSEKEQQDSRIPKPFTIPPKEIEELRNNLSMLTKDQVNNLKLVIGKYIKFQDNSIQFNIEKLPKMTYQKLKKYIKECLDKNEQLNTNNKVLKIFYLFIILAKFGH
jgi:hypothetical protein